MFSRTCNGLALALSVAIVLASASSVSAQQRGRSRKSEPAREVVRRRSVVEILRRGHELTPAERLQDNQHRMRLLQSGLTEKQYKTLSVSAEINEQHRQVEQAKLAADPEIGSLAKIVSCFGCLTTSLSASTLRQIVNREDGAVDALAAAYRSSPDSIWMREAFGRALAAGAPIPDVLRSGTFDAWVRGLGRQADLVEVLWKDAATVRDYDPGMKWDAALHRAARKYRTSKRLSSKDPDLEDARVAALLRRLREAGCL